MSENYPYLLSCKALKTDLKHLTKINITCEDVSTFVKR